MATKNTKDHREYQEWLLLCEQIKSSTPILQENDKEKKARIKTIRNDFVKFCEYYFPHYLDSKFGWFHLDAAKNIEANPNIFAVLEWPREHAKSVFADVFMPLYLYAKGEISGMVIVSANQEKAKGLLGDLQAEFTSNNRWIADYGDLAKMGDWTDGAFSTTDGVGFWALGRGQSPRGIRKAAKRPNYCVVDDIDDKKIVNNQERTQEAVNWILEDLYYALSIKSGARMIIAGNRIDKKSILAHLVGNVEPEDPKREGIYHCIVYAFEKITTHTKGDPDERTSRPAWKERYTRKMLKDKMAVSGYRASRREFFHEHYVEGNIFKEEWIEYVKIKALSRYKSIVVYCDPSFKESEKNDYKAIMVLATDGRKTDILDCWVRQTNSKNMVDKFYDYWEIYGTHARYYMEANFLQDLLLDEFDKEGESRENRLPIRGDKRAKPNKFARIENLTPFFERGIFRFNEELRKSVDFQEFKNQLLGFPYGKDDAPDALEGGFFYLQKRTRSAKKSPSHGKFINKSKYRL
jgi:hypothetical protein